MTKITHFLKCVNININEVKSIYLYIVVQQIISVNLD